jgi:hypothetical protein
MNGVRDGSALLALPKLAMLNIRLPGFAEIKDHGFPPLTPLLLSMHLFLLGCSSRLGL